MELELDTKDFDVVVIPNFVTAMILLFFRVSLFIYAIMFLVCVSLSFVYALVMSEIRRVEEVYEIRRLFSE